MQTEFRKDYSTDQRKAMAKAGTALPDGSFPIADAEDLSNAIQAYGRAKDQAAAKAHIIKRAKALGLESKLPESWDVGSSDRSKPRQSTADVKTEVRFVDTAIEVRSADDSNDVIITGMPVVYNAAYPVQERGRKFNETIQPGAFSGVLSTDPDVKLLVDHTGTPLARTKSGTMTLRDTPQGLAFEARLDPSNPNAQSLISALERGDLDQMSFGFQVGKDSFSSDRSERSISGIKTLHEISAVTFPCSPTTHIQVAKRMMLQDDLDFDLALETVVDEVRAGKVLSAASVAKAQAAMDAIKNLLDSADVDIPLDDDGDTDDNVEHDGGVANALAATDNASRAAALLELELLELC